MLISRSKKIIYRYNAINWSLDGKSLTRSKRIYTKKSRRRSREKSRREMQGGMEVEEESLVRAQLRVPKPYLVRLEQRHLLYPRHHKVND